MMKKINFWISSHLPQKWYWYLAGLINPWQAVLEDTSNLEEVYQRSQDIVKILEKLNLINKESLVLDIGCGVGRAELLLSKKVKLCIGIDISSSMINLAKKHIKSSHVKFYVTNGNDLKMFDDGKFDLVFSILVFQHLPGEVFKNYLKESLRVLKNSGQLAFQIPIYFTQKPEDPPKFHPWALRFYSLVELQDLLKRSGFSQIRFFNSSGDLLKNNQTQALAVAEK